MTFTARRELPVLNSQGQVVGYASTIAHKKAAALAGAASVQQEFRPAGGVRRLCWIPAASR